MRWHRRTALAALATAVAGLGGGVAVAASTHSLPFAAGGGQTTASTAHSRDSTPQSSPNPIASVHGQGSALASDPNTSNSNGPDAAGPAKFGLCTAYAAGHGATNGNKLDSTAFQALVTAAGGVANVSAFCADATPGGNAPHGEGAPPLSSRGGGAADPNTAHANSTSDAHGPPVDPGSRAQNHRP